ncbi:fatty acid desaturase [Burkholderia pseudomallei]|uniref:fatty acid desaturase n=1 Tax=Burkholderia pseudomallei TaxID=28450 RepID=UPI00050DF05C|nr:ABC transporter family protein [Burkholderia pseudomallei]
MQLEVKNLVVHRANKPVLHGVSLAVTPGRVTALVGANGAGKSTLVMSIAGALPATSGDVLLGGAPLGALRPEAVRRLGVAVVPEGHHVLGDLTVRDNLRAAGAFLSARRLNGAIDRALAIFPELEPKLDARANDLSGGQKQMVCVSQALIGEPHTLLIDELSLGLAPTVTKRLAQTVARIANDGVAVLLIEQFTTIALALAAGMTIIAGRQLCLGILQHDAAHGTLFRTRWANDVLVDWLCARPIWNALHKYRPYHLMHHATTSSRADPDLSLVAGLPTTRASLARKCLRDLSGVTGIKFLIGRALMDAGVLQWSLTNDIRRLPQTGRRWWDYPRAFLRAAAGMLITNAILLGALWASGHPWLYGVWVLAYVTPFPLFIRIRSMAEHACLETSDDPLRNTRTTHAGWLARATVAPIRVNYHVEHHLMASVPYFRLPKMHRMLRAHGCVARPPSYWQVLRTVSAKTAA